jgi:hypothetical protein
VSADSAIQDVTESALGHLIENPNPNLRDVVKNSRIYRANRMGYLPPMISRSNLIVEDFFDEGSKRFSSKILSSIHNFGSMIGLPHGAIA